MTLQPELEHEIAELARRFGSPLRWDVELPNDGLFDPLSKRDRHGEVCMVVRRPNGKLITAIKSFYPPGAFRLLTGGIHRRERILDALLRETHEETGLEVEVRRFLAVVNYRLMHRRNANAFTTYAFLIDEVGGRLESLDPDEELGEYREIAVDDLPAMAAFLDNLAATPDEKIHGKWHDWGRFRAVIHRAVYETLKSDEW